MNRYSSYKDSGVEFFGEIPKNWEVVRLKYLCDIGTGNRDTINKEDDGEFPFFVRSKTVEKISSYSYDCEAILTAGDGDICKIWHYINGKFDCHQRVYKLNNFRRINGKFLYYFLMENFEKEVFKLSAKSTVDSLRRPMFENFNVCLPEIKIQEQIVAYLDKKTAIVDTLITSKEEKINLLKENRTALINHTITKGLNPNVEFKDSGVEWIGEIPKHWCVGKLKNYSELRISSIDKHIYEYERKVIVCNYTDVYYNEFITNDLQLRIGSCSEEEYNKFKLDKGDVIITKDSESPKDIGVPSLVSDNFENTVCGYHLSIIKPKFDKLDGGYLFRQIQSNRIRSYYEICSNGITRFGLGKSSVLETPLIIPPLLEQQQIVEYLNTHTQEIDELISLELKKIETLKEYRQALISEVVTGKIKIVED